MRILVLMVAAFSTGCFKSRDSKREALADTQETRVKVEDVTEIPEPGIQFRHQILSDLQSTNRNAVFVAIWTLSKNDIDIPSEIDFESPYSDVEEHLALLAGRIAEMDDSELDELNKSLTYHWKIFSPIWGPKSRDWN